jgi:hypothetical protein
MQHIDAVNRGDGISVLNRLGCLDRAWPMLRRTYPLEAGRVDYYRGLRCQTRAVLVIKSHLTLFAIVRAIAAVRAFSRSLERGRDG